MKTATKFDANKIADLIAQQSFKNSLDVKFESPFAKEARRSGYQFTGGKSDDISVTVGRVEIAGNQ